MSDMGHAGQSADIYRVRWQKQHFRIRTSHFDAKRNTESTELISWYFEKPTKNTEPTWKKNDRYTKNRYRLEILTPTYDYILLFQAPQQNSFTFHFDTNLLCFMMWNLQRQFWMKECDILGGQNILWRSDHSHIFSGGQDPPTTVIYAP